jgi:hypothetical protein
LSLQESQNRCQRVDHLEQQPFLESEIFAPHLRPPLRRECGRIDRATLRGTMAISTIPSSGSSSGAVLFQ